MILNDKPNSFRVLPEAVTGYELNRAGLWSVVKTDGTVVNLNSLGLQIYGYSGAGLPPVENIMHSMGILGGSAHQRSVVKSRQISLMCYIAAGDFLTLQQKEAAVISALTPSLILGKPVKLRYQVVDSCNGNALGKLLEVPVIFDGISDSTVDNLYIRKFALNFIEVTPPSIRELTSNNVALACRALPIVVGSIDVMIKSGTTGAWSVYSTNPNGTFFWYDRDDNLFQQSTFGFYRNNVLISGDLFQIKCAAQAPDGTIYFGGDNSGSTTFVNFNVVKYSGGTITKVGTQTFNSYVNGLECDVNGNVYAVGNFTSPANQITRWNGTSWVSIAGNQLFNGRIYDIKRGLDGYMYVCGEFVTIGSVGNYKTVARYSPTSDTWSPVGSVSGAGGSGTYFNNAASGTNIAYGYNLAVGSDGRIYVAGKFDSVGTTSIKNVAVWNGVSWSPVGAGLNGEVLFITFDKNNILYAFGNSFTGTGDGATTFGTGFARWNGSIWTGAEASLNNGTTDNPIAFNSKNDLVILFNAQASTDNIAGTTALNYAGSASPDMTFTITGPCRLLSIANAGKTLYFDYSLIAGEIATLVLSRSAGITFTSNFTGNVISKILAGSDLTSFSLTPGNNYITALATTSDGHSAITLTYNNTYYTFAAGA